MPSPSTSNQLTPDQVGSASWQQRLPFEIIIRLFVMDVSDQFTDIFENRLGGEGGTRRVGSDCGNLLINS